MRVPDLFENLAKMEPRRVNNRIGARKPTQDSARQPPRAAMVAILGYPVQPEAQNGGPKWTKIGEKTKQKYYLLFIAFGIDSS